MKVVILAGGYGTRLSEESHLKPKPMVEIGDRPILWHIMKTYSIFGFNDFVICCGYKGYVIKEYFANYYMHNADVTFDFRSGSEMTVHNHVTEPWRVTLVDTGLETQTGGRVKRIRNHVGNAPFMLTYGDGVSDIDIGVLVGFHKRHGHLATMTVVQPSGRFGAAEVAVDDRVVSFQEKPLGDKAWINSGFFVLDPAVFDYIADDNTVWERDPLETLAANGELMAYRHRGFWQPMDTLRDKNALENLWKTGQAPWKRW
jgi:glucose-1-phosphate cytidylyltransferase